MPGREGNQQVVIGLKNTEVFMGVSHFRKLAVIVELLGIRVVVEETQTVKLLCTSTES